MRSSSLPTVRVVIDTTASGAPPLLPFSCAGNTFENNDGCGAWLDVGGRRTMRSLVQQLLLICSVKHYQKNAVLLHHGQPVEPCNFSYSRKIKDASPDELRFEMRWATAELRHAQRKKPNLSHFMVPEGRVEMFQVGRTYWNSGHNANTGGAVTCTGVRYSASGDRVSVSFDREAKHYHNVRFSDGRAWVLFERFDSVDCEPLTPEQVEEKIRIRDLYNNYY